MVKYEKGKEAKYAETVDEEEMGQRVEGQENYWDKEPDIPVHASVFVISQPFSAINPTLLPDSFADAQDIFDEFEFHIECEVNGSDLPPLKYFEIGCAG
ncbi:unnamed protein product [Gongylonema pulchrum]|uniref:Uncharacterized protein n=1 Tax=Gongylonema pulchrum TaxID=637853 RepID=A0A183EPW9_9BILA|nr:unnamed protein product [Gongylonema pulchrum]